MNNIVLNYLLKNFLKKFFIILLIFYCFGVILNLFEEVEFFKNLNVGIFTPLILTSILIPGLLIKILPFIVFISSMWFMINLRNSKDLLTLKFFGYSNLKIFFILAITSFLLGWAILIFANPLTSTLSKYYEKTKSNYSKDIDHLVSFNKNGLWIKENLGNRNRIISATKPKDFNLIDVTIFHLGEDTKLIEKIEAKKANVKDYNWILEDVVIFKHKDGIFDIESFENYEIKSIYNHDKITSLFKNFDTMSFHNSVLNYKSLIDKGYNKPFLIQSLHSMLVLPFFLLLMTGLASVFTMNTMKKSDNFRLIILGLITSVLTFYLKDLSLALGQTDRIPLVLAIWAPIIALSLFTFIGVLQINEK